MITLKAALHCKLVTAAIRSRSVEGGSEMGTFLVQNMQLDVWVDLLSQTSICCSLIEYTGCA